MPERAPTDVELSAAIERGLADGSLVAVDDDFLAQLAATIEED